MVARAGSPPAGPRDCEFEIAAIGLARPQVVEARVIVEEREVQIVIAAHEIEPFVDAREIAIALFGAALVRAARRRRRVISRVEAAIAWERGRRGQGRDRRRQRDPGARHADAVGGDPDDQHHAECFEPAGRDAVDEAAFRGQQEIGEPGEQGDESWRDATILPIQPPAPVAKARQAM
jgi:hypothetical protein